MPSTSLKRILIISLLAILSIGTIAWATKFYQQEKVKKNPTVYNCASWYEQGLLGTDCSTTECTAETIEMTTRCADIWDASNAMTPDLWPDYKPSITERIHMAWEHFFRKTNDYWVHAIAILILIGYIAFSTKKTEATNKRFLSKTLIVLFIAIVIFMLNDWKRRYFFNHLDGYTAVLAVSIIASIILQHVHVHKVIVILVSLVNIAFTLLFLLGAAMPIT